MMMLALSLFAGPAHAEEPAAPATDCASLEGDDKSACEAKAAETAMAETKAALEALGDCSTKEADAKTTCETEKAALEAKLAPAAEEAPADEGKGGKAQRGNTNRMEGDVTEE